jgi:hypothetical protein
MPSVRPPTDTDRGTVETELLALAQYAGRRTFST